MRVVYRMREPRQFFDLAILPFLIDIAHLCRTRRLEPFRSRRARQRGILWTSFDCLIMITIQTSYPSLHTFDRCSARKPAGY
jgi:hypothetical protein